MSKKKSSTRERMLSQKESDDWELAHPPGQPAVSEDTWLVDSEYGEMSFANFESAYAYANGLTLGDFRRKIINRDKRLIEVWLSPDQIHELQQTKNENVQADAAGLPC